MQQTHPIWTIAIITGLLACAPLPAAARIIVQNIIQNAAPLDATEHFVSSSPADGETLVQPPQEITITFSRQVRPDRLVIHVYDPYGTQLAATPAVNGLIAAVTLKNATKKGRYRVQWRAECACDDHTEMSDRFYFTVK